MQHPMVMRLVSGRVRNMVYMALKSLDGREARIASITITGKKTEDMGIMANKFNNYFKSIAQ